MDELKWEFEQFYDYDDREQRRKAELIASYGEGDALIDATLWSGEIVDEVQPDLRALAMAMHVNERSDIFDAEDFAPPSFEEVLYGGDDTLTIAKTAEDVVDKDTFVLSGVRAKRMIRRPEATEQQQFKDYELGCDSEKSLSDLIESEPIRKVWVTARRRNQLVSSGLPLFLDALLHGTAKKHNEEIAEYCQLAGLSYKSSKEKLAEEIENVQQECRKLISDAMWKLTQLAELARTHDHLVNEM